MGIKIIAEPACYFHGDLGVLEETMLQCIAVGADIFKVQVYDAKYMGNAWKHKKEFYKNCQIESDTLISLRKKAEGYGTELLATVNQPHLVKKIYDAGIRSIKIASGQISAILIGAVNEFTWDRVFVSTGMLDSLGTLKLINYLKSTKEVVVMHCVSLYPTCEPETNLLRIDSLRNFFKNNELVTIGYSDHHMDELPSLGAMFRGATYIEKHIKIDLSFGPTSEIAADMVELRRMCNLRLRINVMLGDGKLVMQDREKESYDKYKTRWLTVIV